MSETEIKKRPWVYQRLVQGDNDFVGLIAYGIYKRRKTELAQEHRANGCDEDQIEEKIRDFHDQVVTGNVEIDRYRRDAGAMLEKLLSQVGHEIRLDHAKQCERLKTEYDKQCEELLSQHAKDIVKVKKQAVDDVAKAAKGAKNNLGVRDRFVAWLLDGVQTTLAGILVTVASFGIVALLTSDNLKAEMAAKTVQMLTGSTPKP